MGHFKVTTWNVNSIKARLERVLPYLERERPDVVCLQELKCVEEAFPFGELERIGYHALVHGQRTYNGVAVLSRRPARLQTRGFGDGADDPQARFLMAEVAGVHVASAYIPNGQAVGSEKYAYKLEWLARLRRYLERSFRPTDPVLVCGDFNVAPEDRDVHDPHLWEGKILFSEAEKSALREVCAFGLHDTFRRHHSESGQYSWWDYRMLSFPKNQGLRIDFVLATEPLLARCTAAAIDRNERRGKQPSDHAPVTASFSL